MSKWAGPALLAITVALGACSSSGQQAAAPSMQLASASATEGGKTKKANDPNRVICTREHRVGSNKPRVRCATVREREELRIKSRQLADDTGKADVDQGEDLVP